MKHIIKLILLIILTIPMTGCKVIENLPLLAKDTKTEAVAETNDGKFLKYSIEQVILSKGYQTIEPKVEIVSKKSNRIKLLASLGLLESSGVEVDRITIKGNMVNIYVVNKTEEETIQLAVPQIIIEINQRLKNVDELKFNIVNENYRPLTIKLGLNDIINKINSEFKVTANTAPEINLSKLDDILIWNITYNSIFDRDNPEIPLVNLSVEIDANSGNIVKSTKRFISSMIDEGHVLDYIHDKYILYKKLDNDLERNLITENLWLFDIENNEKVLMFTTKAKIQTAIFSPDYKNISLTEANDNSGGELYIIPITDVKAYKVIFNEPIIPTFINWKDNNNLYIIENNKTTDVYTFNLEDNQNNLIGSYNFNIIDVKSLKDNTIVVTPDENKINKKFFLTKDWDELKFIDYGFNIKFIDDYRISYFKNDEKEDKNSLFIYDIAEKKKIDIIEKNLSNYGIISTIIVIRTYCM